MRVRSRAITLRHLQAIDLLRRGYSNPEIAAHFNVRKRTVVWYFGDVYFSLGIKSDRQLMALICSLRPTAYEVISAVCINGEWSLITKGEMTLEYIGLPVGRKSSRPRSMVDSQRKYN